MDGEFRGEWIHINVWVRPFTAYQRLSQYCLLISYTLIQNKMFKKTSGLVNKTPQISSLTLYLNSKTSNGNTALSQSYFMVLP